MREEQDVMPGQSIDGEQWAGAWLAASARMTELRRQELARVDVARVIEGLSDAYESALRLTPPRTTSGLVEQQALFAKARR
jgi:hypothetical protein